MEKDTAARFEQIMKEFLIKAYTDEYGMEAWTSKTAEERTETLHELLGSFLTVCKRRAEARNR